MISLALQDALDTIAQRVLPINATKISPTKALGWVLRDAVFSPSDYPKDDLSLMDGYAVKAENTPGDLTLVNTLSLQVGEAQRTRTGMPIPQGANAVALQEHVSSANVDGVSKIVAPLIAPKAYIRQKGEIFSQGAELIPKGTCLREKHIALMASLEIDAVVARPPPCVAIAAVGDELKPTPPLAKGEYVDVSRYLGIWLQKRYGVSVWHAGIIADSTEDLKDYFDKACRQKVDMVLTMGGSGKGPTDHTGSLLQSSHAQCLFHQLKIQPGKPSQFGIVDDLPTLILPGRVLAAFMMTATLGSAVVRALMSYAAIPSLWGCIMQEQEAKKHHRDNLLLATIKHHKEGTFIHVLDTSLQQSDSLFGLTQATGYIYQKAGESLGKGSIAEFFPF